MSEYEAQATKFLTDHGLEIKTAFKGDRCPLWDDDKHIHGDRYRVTIKRGKCLHDSKSMLPVECTCDRPRSVTFDFWNSHADRQAGKSPTAYDVLACVSSDLYYPETFEEFCSEYGYEQDSRKAEQTFKAADKFGRKLRAFFTEKEAEDLSEIN